MIEQLWVEVLNSVSVSIHSSDRRFYLERWVVIMVVEEIGEMNEDF